MNDTTTVPAGPAEVRYLADALGDYLAQHAGPRSASRAVAERLGAVLPPAVLNLVTDALDAPRGHSADLVIVDDPDDAPAPAIAPGRYRITFGRGLRGEARVGRTYNVPPLEAEHDGIYQAVWNTVRPLLTSGHVDVHINPGPTPTAGAITVYCGAQIGATATYERIDGPDAEVGFFDALKRTLDEIEGVDYGTPPAHEYDGPHYDAPAAQG